MQQFREDWSHKYVPKYKLETDDILDLYNAKNADEYFWGLSQKRFNQERNKGRLGRAVRLAV